MHTPKNILNIVNSFYKKSIYLVYLPKITTLPICATGGGFFFADGKYYVERDNLDMYLILITIRGSGTIVYRNKTVILNIGQAILLDGHEYHMYKTSSNSQKWDFKWIRFTTKHISCYDGFINNSGLVPVSTLNSEIDDLSDTYLRYMKSNEQTKEIQMCGIITQILTIMCSLVQTQKNLTNENRSLDIEKAKNFIVAHYDQRLDIGHVAEIVHLNKYTFIRKFKNMLGFTPYAFLQKERINFALLLLETTNSSIDEIADHVGFTDQNNFAKQFKKYVGESPSSYRIKMTSK